MKYMILLPFFILGCQQRFSLVEFLIDIVGNTVCLCLTNQSHIAIGLALNRTQFRN